MTDSPIHEYKTRHEIERLKDNWCNDPCWDLETTEGFEAHHDELLAFSIEQKQQWSIQHHLRLARKAGDLGIPGNTTLAQYIESLEQRISTLERQVDELRHYEPSKFRRRD